MWKYHRPGFESLLLAELQRQQRCSQFCDTVLRAEGVSVPAHSCILSALSPQLSCALASSMPLPSGQSHLLEFKDFGACALLRLVSLLYSGEMMGEGEVDRFEVITAATRMGIHGLVEVGLRQGWADTMDKEKSRARPGQKNVGVQTESLYPTEAQTNRGTTGEWNLLPEMSHVDEAIDFQGTRVPASVATTDPDFLPTQVSQIPLSQVLIYPPEEINTTALMTSIDEWTGAGNAPIYVIPPSHASLSTSTSVNLPPVTVLGPVTESILPFSSDLTYQSWGAGTKGEQVLAKDRVEGREFEQFEGNIAGFISYFLNPSQENRSKGGRKRGRRRGVGIGGRRAGGGERRARRPRGRPRGGGGATRGVKKAAKEDQAGVPSGTSRGQLCRWGVTVSRTGRGGGAVGRKLYLKTRDLLKPIKICLRRRGRGEVWEISSPVKDHGGGAGKESRRRGKSQQKEIALPPLNQNGFPVIKTQKSQVKTIPFPAFPQHLYNALTSEPESHPLCPIPSSSPGLSLSTPALQRPAPYLSPAPALLHTAPLPPLAQPPQEDSAEQFERMLEDIMIGLDLMPRVATMTQHHVSKSSPCPHPTTRTYNNQQQNPTCPQVSTRNASDFTMVIAQGVVPAASNKGGCDNNIPCVHQQPGEGNLNDILDNFLWSFEQQVVVATETGGRNNTPHGNDRTKDSQSEPYTLIKSYESNASSATYTHASNSTHTHIPNTSSLPPIQSSADVVPVEISDFPAIKSAYYPSAAPLTCTCLHSCPSPSEKDGHEGEGTTLTWRQGRERTGVPEESSSSSSEEGGILKDTSLIDAQLSLIPPSKQSQPNVPSEPPPPAEQAKRVSLRQIIETSRVMAKRMRIRKRFSARLSMQDHLPQTAENIQLQPAVCVVGGDKNKPLTESKCQPRARGPIRRSPRFRERTDQLKQGPIKQDGNTRMAKTLPAPVHPPVKSTRKNSCRNQRTIPLKTYPIRNNCHQKICLNKLYNKPAVPQWPPNEEVSILPSDPTRSAEERVQRVVGVGDAKPRRGRGRAKKTKWLDVTAVDAPSAVPPLEKRTHEDTEDERAREPEVEVTSRRIEKRREDESEQNRTAGEERERKRICLGPLRREPLLTVAGADLTAYKALSEPGEEEAVTEEEVDIEIAPRQANEKTRTLLPPETREQVEGTHGQEGGKHIGLFELKTKEVNQIEEKTKIEVERGLIQDEEDNIVDVEEDSDVSIDVVGEEDRDSGGLIQEKGHIQLQRKMTTWLHSGAAKCSGISNPSRCTGEVSLGSTGCGNEEEEEVDVLGGFSPSSDPLPSLWGSRFRPEEDAEEEEIDVIGEDMDYTPSIGPLSFRV